MPWTAEEVKKIRSGTTEGKWNADMVKNIRAGNSVNINDPVERLSTFERDRAIQERREKTLINLSQGAKTTPTTPSLNNFDDLRRESDIIQNTEPKQNLLQKIGNFTKDVITDPLGTLDRIDQSQFGKDIMAGVGLANKATVNVLKSIGGDKVPVVKDVLGSIENEANRLIQQGGTGIMSQVVQSLPRAGSNMALAFLSGGTSIPAQLGGNATLQAAKQLFTSPTFVNSMLQSYGSAYGQAREEGADRPQAITKAVLQALPEALIEQAGGVEQLPKQAGQGLLKTIGKSALEEGLEEITQYPFEAIAKKATYAPNTPIFSMEENAVINPKEMAQSALVVGIAGGLLGGGTKIITGDVSLPKFKRDIQQQQTAIEQIQQVQQTEAQQQAAPTTETLK